MENVDNLKKGICSENKTNIIKRLIIRFCESDLYLPICAIVIFALWFIDFEIGLLLFGLSTAILTYIYKNDMLPIFALMALMFFSSRFVYAVQLITTMILGFAYMCRNNIRVPKNKMLLSCVFIAFAFIWGGFDVSKGLISFYDFLMPIGMALFLGFMIIMFTGMAKKDCIDYVMKVVLTVGILVSFELIAYYLNVGDFEKMKDILDKKDIYMNPYLDVMKGWGSSNNVAGILLFTLPSALYFVTKGRKGYFYFLPFLLILGALVLTGSRGALLIAVAALIPMIFYTLYATENFKNTFVSLIVIAVIGACGMLYFWDKFEALFNVVFETGFGASNRDVMYAEILTTFLKCPIFGFGHSFYSFGYAHCFLLQFLGSMGIMGFIAICYHLFVKYKIVFVKKSNVAIFATLCMFLCDGYSLLERNFFIPPFAFLAVFVFIAIVNSEERSVFKKVKIQKPFNNYCEF